MEVWKKIEGFENYSISSFGNVRNDTTNRLLCLSPNVEGYISVDLRRQNKRKIYKVHRLVALNFVPNFKNKPTVNHIDKNPSNNKIENLEWATYSEQNFHKSKNSIFPTRCVWRIDKNTNEKIESYNSLKLASLWIKNNVINIFSRAGTIQAMICEVCRKKRVIAYGYKWEYNDKIETLDGEIWKNLTKCDGYKISNFGRIINKTGRLANHTLSKNGYWWASVGYKNYRIHRLVAEEFIPNLDNKLQVNHIDGNKNNYKSSNLEWVTNKENITHAIESGLHNLKKVKQLSLNGNTLGIFNGYKDASRKTKACRNGISQCCKGKRNVCGGFKWKYTE